MDKNNTRVLHFGSIISNLYRLQISSIWFLFIIYYVLEKEQVRDYWMIVTGLNGSGVLPQNSFTFIHSFISDSKVHSKNRNRWTEQTDKQKWCMVYVAQQLLCKL